MDDIPKKGTLGIYERRAMAPIAMGSIYRERFISKDCRVLQMKEIYKYIFHNFPHTFFFTNFSGQKQWKEDDTGMRCSACPEDPSARRSLWAFKSYLQTKILSLNWRVGETIRSSGKPHLLGGWESSMSRGEATACLAAADTGHSGERSMALSQGIAFGLASSSSLGLGTACRAVRGICRRTEVLIFVHEIYSRTFLKKLRYKINPSPKD